MSEQKMIKLESRTVSFFWDGEEHIGEVTKELENGLYFQYICRNKLNSEYIKEIWNEFFKWSEISRLGFVTRTGKLRSCDHPKLKEA